MIRPSDFSHSLTELAKSKGFTVTTLIEVGGYPILALTRTTRKEHPKPLRIYLSSGVHGDEPAGPLAIERLLIDDLLPSNCDLTIIPLINPTGFEIKTRENKLGHDLNRDFRFPKNPETRSLKDFLDKQAPYDLSISLHEDWESTGFYLYSLSPDNDSHQGKEILQAVSKVGAIDLSPEIDGHPATAGLIDQPADFDLNGRDDWPEAFLLYSKSQHAHYTMESSSAAPLEQRIAQHTAAVVQAIAKHCD